MISSSSMSIFFLKNSSRSFCCRVDIVEEGGGKLALSWGYTFYEVETINVHDVRLSKGNWTVSNHVSWILQFIRLSMSLFHIAFAAAVWLSYDHYFEKKIARFRRAAARPPYWILKPPAVTSHIIFPRCPLLLRNSHNLRGRKTISSLDLRRLI